MPRNATETITAADLRSDARARGKRNRAQGANAEMLVRAELVRLGYRLVERVHTPWRIARDGKGKIVGATPVERVSGDFRAVSGDGRSVLVEAKSSPGRLRWSQLEAHQVRALNEHHEAGGISLLAWVDTETWEVKVWQWPIPGFGPRRSIR